MNYKLIGYENFTSKKGVPITKLHCAFKKPNSNTITGTCVESFFILTENVPSDIYIDCYINVFYGRQGSNGFLSGIQIIDNN